jgi:branched-chain amino acid transport system ATP-binding protein
VITETIGRVPVLQVDRISTGYDETTVLRGLSLEVAPGSVVALLGPNGAGKTTLLRAIAGDLRCTAGSIRLDGDDVTKRAVFERVRKGLCHIPEGRAIYPTLTVKENLALHSVKGREKESIARATDVFPMLGRRLGQVAGSMSGGEQQMLALVRAYIRETRIVLIDEASLGLAPLIVDQLFEFMGRLRESGTSLLVVEQYVHRALALADHAFVLASGEIVFSGPTIGLDPDEVFRRYMGVEVAG